MAPVIFLIVILFILIGKAADIVITGVRGLAQKLRVNLFLAGMVLGLFTSLPEITIGINALAERIPALSFGNLIGGTLVLFGPILGLSLILNRRVTTDGKWRSILPITLYLMLPLLYGIDGVISKVDGSILIFGYLAVLYYTYHSHQHAQSDPQERRYDVSAELLTIIIGMVGVFVCANAIIHYTHIVLDAYRAPTFLVGLIAFSLGTNLPELTVTIRSWRRHIRDLSISNLIGSALTNGLTIGAFALMLPITVAINYSYLALFVGNTVLLGTLSLFYRSDKAFTRVEGVALIVLYSLTALSVLLLAVY